MQPENSNTQPSQIPQNQDNATTPPQSPQEQTSPEPNRVKGILSLIGFIAGVLIAAFLINQFIFQSYFVDGTSMTPTLQNNDRLIIEKVSRSFSLVTGRAYIPARGQIVVLDSSLLGTNGQEQQLIKRVIGLPGETVIIKDGVVTIKNAQNPNGFNVDNALGLELEETYSKDPIEVTIPEDQVYVLGDNRGQNGSHDSRLFGPVESKKLEGRLWARVLPLTQAQVFAIAW